MDGLGRILIVLGIVIVVAGALIMVLSRLGIGIGQLPGDFSWSAGDTQIHFPLMTMIIVSIVLTVLLNVIFRLFR